MTKQKIVIKLAMKSGKSGNKAMVLAAAAAARGVESVALAGDARDQLVVVGDDVDTVELGSALRRKIGRADLVEVSEVKVEEKKKKNPEAPAAVAEYTTYPFHHGYNSYPLPPVYHQYPFGHYY